jgi:alkylhydroperoxidase/carboxymuconolactone decarboxylase family protein YurZ
MSNTVNSHSDTTSPPAKANGPGTLLDRLVEHLKLPQRTIYLVAIAVAASPSANGDRLLQAYVDRARKSGVSIADIMEARRLGAAIALHSITWGLDRVAEELRQDDSDTYAHLWEEPSGSLVSAWSREPFPGRALAREYAPEAHRVVYDAFVTDQVPESRVTALERELIFVAIDINCSHMLERGAKSHARHSLELGASVRDLAEVGVLAAVLGEASLAAPIVFNE